MEASVCKFTRSSIDNRQIECMVCNGECIEAYEINQMALSQKTEIICGYCDKTLKSKLSFQFHLNSFHQDCMNEPKSYIEMPSTSEQIAENVMDDPEHSEDWIIEDFITSCLFISDPESPKNVKCVECTQDCQTEASINETKMNAPIEIPCQCGIVLKDRHNFYKHFVFFHGEELKKVVKTEVETEDDEMDECSFKYDINAKIIRCCKHVTNERDCESLHAIRSAKSTKELNILCFCGRTLKTRLSFQKHFEHIHKDLIAKEEKEEKQNEIVIIQQQQQDNSLLLTPPSCRFTRDPKNHKSIVCVTCVTNKCPMFDRIKSSKLFEELYVPCECGKVLKNRCNFLKHYKIFHELGLGVKEKKAKKQRIKRSYEPPLTDEDERSFASSNCEFTIQWKDNHKRIVCTVCPSVCAFSQVIRTANMSRELNIPCFCGKILRSRKRYLQHFNLVHSGGREKKKSCSVCGLEFETKRERYEHEAREHNIEFKYTCDNCGRKFFRSDYLSYHLESCGKQPTIRQSTRGVMACGICNFTFMREETFIKHLETAHKDVDATADAIVKKQETAVIVKQESKVKVEEKLAESKAICKVCSKSFVTIRVLERHIKQVHEQVTINCDKCGESFIHESTLNTHMVKFHGKPRKFQCTICDYGADKKNRFKAHMDKHANPDMKFICPICEQQFNSFDTMMLHRSRHKVKEPLVCQYCEKQFIDKQSFKNHVKLHTREDLIRCEYCDKGFVKKSVWQKHIVKCHEESSEVNL